MAAPLHHPLRRWVAPLLLVSLLLAPSLALNASAQDVTDTRLVADPAVSQTHIAFVYAGDLWVANRDGSGVRRLTTHDGDEQRPRFSPDGQTLAFSAEYDGNMDVYTVPVAGGVPTRLTWHPGNDLVQAFTPDGTAVLFLSPRQVYTNRHAQLFTISVDGGMPERLPVPHAAEATFSPDGDRLAYTPLSEAFRQWKNYRGGRTSRIWLFDRDDYDVTEIPKPDGGSNDTNPMWIGDSVYFLSDRNGEFNLYRYDVATEAVEQLTDHADFPILAAAAGDGVILYEQAGYLHVFDPAAGTSQKLTVGVTADLIETRPRYAGGAEWIRDAHISPSGARAVFEYRGEIVTVPAEKGDPRNLTQSPATHERSPAWSPDGQWIAYVSDASGEYELHLAPQDGRGEVRTFALDGAGFYEDLRWSPDGTMLSFTDNAWSLYTFDVEEGTTTQIASEPLYGPFKELHHAWSPDSKWLAYTLNTTTYQGQLHLYSVETGESRPVTDGLSDVGEPVFDASGKYVYFHASTDAGPINTWFAMSNNDLEATRALYLAVLPAGEESPLAKESDEEPGVEAEDTEEEVEGDGPPATVVDFDDLNERILALPVEEAMYASLQAGPAGHLYYLKSDPSSGGGGPAHLMRFSLESREEETIAENVSAYMLTPDGAKALLASQNQWAIADAGATIAPGTGHLNVDAIEVKIEPRAEWEQMFHEAWRINRDYFYDPNYHGADWPAMREKYAAFLPDLAWRQDLNRVIRWMLSELSVGHSYLGGGERLEDADRVPGGLLGADFEVADGRYRFAKVYGGLNWNPDLRSPLTEPGVEVDAGEYLLAVNGEALAPPENLYRRFENTAGKLAELTVGPNADGSGSRTIQVVPVESETTLRNRDWVEGNIEKVHDATDGRVAYVYVPNTTTLGHTYFKRYFFPQADKQAIIVDERFNGGGQVADYYIDILRRPYISHWATRYGQDLRTPQGAILGPKVMLIDETAGSGGDLLPWMFRKLELGTLIGKRTWGGLVGILGFPVLMDGGFVTAPNLAIWTENEGFTVENEGVPPDIEVEQLPAAVNAGQDPQLDRAIEVILQQLEANPPQEPQRPAFPIRVHEGG